MLEIMFKILGGIGGLIFGAWEMYDGVVQVKEGLEERRALLNEDEEDSGEDGEMEH